MGLVVLGGGEVGFWWRSLKVMMMILGWKLKKLEGGKDGGGVRGCGDGFSGGDLRGDAGNLRCWW